MQTARQFIQNLPNMVDPAALEDKTSLFHFLISGDGGGDFTVQIKDGTVHVEEGIAGEPKCVVKTTDENFMKVINGNLNPMMAILTGKIKISNQGEMIKYAKVFGLMK